MTALVGREQPRIFTPPKRELTPETSLGFKLIDFSEQVLEITLPPWQKWLAIHALELTEDGLPRFSQVVVEVARQNGKSTFSQVLALFYLYLLDAKLVVESAQDVASAKKIWEGALQIVEDIPDLAAELAGRPRTTNGQIMAKFTGFREYVVKPPTAGGARGLSADLVIMDELRQQKTWDGWAALTATTTARPASQVWAFSNAGDSAAIVLRNRRAQAHRLLGDPDGFCREFDPSLLLDDDAELAEVDDDALGWFEWSAPPGAKVSDRDAWAWANPSLGTPWLTERKIRSNLGIPEAQFRIEYLCQFVDGSLEGPFPPGAWEAGIGRGRGLEPLDAVVAAVEVAWDRTKAAIVFAGQRADGRPQAEVVAYRAGTSWVREWLTSSDRAIRPDAVVVRTHGPAATLIEELSEARYSDGASLNLMEWSGAEVSRGCAQLYDAVVGDVESEEPGPLVHAAHTTLDTAAGSAQVRPFGDTWSWDMKTSAVDISPLVALTGAVWGLSAKPKPTRSRYEDDDAELAFI